MSAPKKEKTDKQLRALGARIDKAATADEFADAIAALVGQGKGGVTWVEARALWALIERGQMTRKQAVEALTARLGETIKLITENMRAARKSLQDN